MEDRIRVVALGVVRREGVDGEELLVERAYDPDGDDASDGDDVPNGGDASDGDDAFYRPLGGGVEFGEHSADALGREFDEELGVSLANVSYLETYEEVFTDDGETEHEVWRLYEADISESWLYEEDEFEGYEPETDQLIECVWKPLSELRCGETFYPEPLLADLD